MAPMLLLPPTFNYASVGRCVYCETTTVSLTKEHIVPRGLHGNLVIPAASCGACSKVTSDIERRVLRGFMERGRRAMGISSRHKKHAKSTLLPTIFIGADDSTWEVETPVDGSPQVIHLPVFIPPLRLGGISKDGNPRTLEIFAIDTLNIGSAEPLVREYGAVGVQFKDHIDGWAFVRMLGKIAHCYYIAEKGWFPLRQSPVLPVVMGKSNLAKDWIGCVEDVPLVKQGSRALHLMDITDLTGEDGSVCSVVRIKLFSPTSGPTYAVVTRIQEAVAGVA